jgi:hypothetical protein
MVEQGPASLTEAGLKQSRWLLVLICLEGLLAVLWTFLSPSETGSAVFLWLSPQRILLLAFSLALWLGILAATITFWRSPIHFESIHRKLDHWCLEQQRLGSFLIFLFVIPFLILVALLIVALTPLDFAAYRSWAPDTFPLLHASVGATLPLLLFSILVCIECGMYLAIRYRQAVIKAETWSWERIGLSLILVLITVTTVFHWIILGFQLRIFANNPAWYWKIKAIGFTWRDVGFSLAAMGLLALIYWMLILRRRVLIGLLLVFLLGWFLQIGVGIMASGAGGGLASVGERYLSTYHKTYLSKASQNHTTILESIRRYEDLYGSRLFTNTKPPGLMAFYIGLEGLINGSPSAYSDDVRYARLSAAVTYIFPVIAMSMVFLLYAFANKYLPGRAALVSTTAPLLFVLCPNIVLFSLFPDQAIYPFIFLLGVWLTIVVIRRGSVIWGFLLGIFLYTAVFFAFTMLPLYPFAGIYLALNYWMNRKSRSLKQQIWIAIAISAGTLLLYLLFRLLLNYDFLPRFEKTMAINHNFDFYLRVGQPSPFQPETLSVRLGQIIGAAWLNNLDFAAGMGFPIYILFAVQSVRLLIRLFKGTSNTGDIILAAFLLSFIVLNLAGTAQGEVPRLWLFWLPMVVILAALEIEQYVQKKPAIVFILALIQFVTIVLTFHFQDLRM